MNELEKLITEIASLRTQLRDATKTIKKLNKELRIKEMDELAHSVAKNDMSNDFF